MSLALAAGVPQVLLPCAHDQFDNAERLVRLGCGMRLGVPLRYLTYDTAGKMADAVKEGAWDVAFLAVDPARAPMPQPWPDNGTPAMGTPWKLSMSAASIIR